MCIYNIYIYIYIYIYLYIYVYTYRYMYMHIHICISRYPYIIHFTADIDVGKLHKCLQIQ